MNGCYLQTLCYISFVAFVMFCRFWQINDVYIMYPLQNRGQNKHMRSNADNLKPFVFDIDVTVTAVRMSSCSCLGKNEADCGWLHAVILSHWGPTMKRMHRDPLNLSTPLVRRRGEERAWGDGRMDRVQESKKTGGGIGREEWMLLLHLTYGGGRGE